MTTSASQLKKHVKEYSGFPKDGVTFLDILPILADPTAFQLLVEMCVQQIEERCRGKVDVVLGIESRGFLIGPVIANKLGVGFAAVRKKGKLPGRVHSQTYSLEYGTDTIEVQEACVKQGQTVVIVDDLLATGGTMSAAVQLLEKLGATVAFCLVVIELKGLKGREKVNAPVGCLLEY